MTRHLSILLAFALVLGLLPVSAIAAATEVRQDVAEWQEEGIYSEEALAIQEDIQHYYSEMSRAAKLSKAIIVIPGIAGTALKIKNPDRLVWLWAPNLKYLKCNENGASEYELFPTTEGGLKWPLITYGIFNLYKPMCERLKKEFGTKYDVVFFPYDWRMNNSTIAAQLKDFIDTSGYSEVILVAHSMGGLVASKYIASDVGQRKTKKLVTLGTPYLGAPRSIYVMETGDMFGIAENKIKDLANNFPAVYQLMPQSKGFSNYIQKNGTVLNGYLETTNFLKTLSWGKKSNGSAKPMFTVANAFNNTLYTGANHIVNSGKVPIYKIYGSDLETIKTVCYDANGKYTDVITTNAGDGTVLAVSARCGNYSNVAIVRGAEHLKLISDTNALDKMVSFIKGASRAAALQLAPSVNSRGWIEGLESSKLIKIVVPEEAKITLRTADGLTVQAENDCLYAVHENGESERVGTVWHLGYGEEYSLYDRGYELTINAPAEQEKSDVSVQYFDSGYYKKLIEYDDNGQYDITRLSVSSFEEMEVHYEGVRPFTNTNSSKPVKGDATIQPARVLYEESLINIKQGELR